MTAAKPDAVTRFWRGLLIVLGMAAAVASVFPAVVALAFWEVVLSGSQESVGGIVPSLWETLIMTALAVGLAFVAVLAIKRGTKIKVRPTPMAFPLEPDIELPPRQRANKKRSKD